MENVFKNITSLQNDFPRSLSLLHGPRNSNFKKLRVKRTIRPLLMTMRMTTMTTLITKMMKTTNMMTKKRKSMMMIIMMMISSKMRYLFQSNLRNLGIV